MAENSFLSVYKSLGLSPICLNVSWAQPYLSRSRSSRSLPFIGCSYCQYSVRVQRAITESPCLNLQDQTARASEARLLEAELQRERAESSSLKSQLAEAQNSEKEKNALAEKVSTLEAKLENLVIDRVASKESELHATYDERLRNYADRSGLIVRVLNVQS